MPRYARVNVERGHARGRRARKRRDRSRPPRVVANVNPKLLFERLVAPEHLDGDFRARIDGYRCGSGTFRMNVALVGAARFHLPARSDRRNRITAAASSSRRRSRTWSARTSMRSSRGWSRAPIVEMLIPSVVDDSLAPRGMHVASLFCQHANPRIGDVLPGPHMGRCIATKSPT